MPFSIFLIDSTIEGDQARRLKKGCISVTIIQQKHLDCIIPEIRGALKLWFKLRESNFWIFFMDIYHVC